MLQNGLIPDVKSYTAAIDACSKGGQWQKAVELLHEMPQHRLKADVTCYNATIDACSKGGQWQKAVEVLREMQQQGLKPNAISYNATIDACSTCAQWQEAIKLLREMQQQQLVANIVTYSRVINACQKGEQWQLTLDLLAELKAASLQPDVITHNCVIDALHVAHEHEKAEVMYVEMLQCGITQHHWSKVRQGMLYFHDFTVGMAAAAMRIVLRDILWATDSDASSNSDVHVHDVCSDLHIITGHATHRKDKDGSVLQQVIISMLKQQGIDCRINSDNKGRLIVKSSELQRYVEYLSSE
jgi:pentatricopeptide repeat protein